MATTRTKRSTRRQGDYTVVAMVRGFIDGRDAQRWVRENLGAFRRVAQGGRGSRIARWGLAAARWN